MEVCLRKLEKNVNLVLKRDVEDCQNKLLTGYLKCNVHANVNIRGNADAMACEHFENKRQKAGNFMKANVVLPRAKEVHTNEKSKNEIQTSLETNFENCTTSKRRYTKEKSDIKQSNEVDKVCRKTPYRREYTKETLNKRLLFPNTSESKFLLNYKPKMPCLKLTREGLLPRNGEFSARSNSVTGRFCSSIESDSLKSAISGEYNKNFAYLSSSKTQNSAESEISKDGFQDVKSDNCTFLHLIETNMEHVPSSIFPEKSNTLSTSEYRNKLSSLNSDTFVNVETILNYRSGTISRAHLPENRKTDANSYPRSLPRSNLLSICTALHKKSRTLATRAHNSQKPVLMPVNLVKPVLLKMKHRQDKFVSRRRETYEEGRLLPTTLSNLNNGSYSVMTPYMASVVWSIMADESLDKSFDKKLRE